MKEAFTTINFQARTLAVGPGREGQKAVHGRAAMIVWKASGGTICGEPGNYCIKVVRSDVGRIRWCVIYCGMTASGSRDEIGTARSIAKAKKLAEHHATANKEIT
jgi:hypothetical protein